MRKIWIAGSAGSGKTTLALAVGEKYDIPVYHRDDITWDENSCERSEQEQVEIVREITQKDQFIFEGARFTSAVIDGRLDNCDAIIYLNINRFTCLFRALRRWYEQSRGNPSKAEYQPFGFRHIKSVLWDYPRKAPQRRKIFQLARQNHIDVILLNGVKSVNRFYLEHDLEVSS